MAMNGLADGSALEVTDLPGRPWWGEGFFARLSRGLSRSATIALLLSPVGLLVVSAVRLLIIADYNTVTAVAIASSGGYFGTLLGTALPLIPVFLPYLALLFMLMGRVILAGIAIVAALLVSPAAVGGRVANRMVSGDWHHVFGDRSALTIVGISALGVMFALALISEIFAVGPNALMKTLISTSCIALIPIVLQIYPSPLNGQLYGQVLRQPWLPAQAITLNNGQEFTGYVLADDPGWIIVLKNADRRVLYYPDTEVTSRRLCQLELTRNMRPLIAFMTAAAADPGIPVCPPS